MAASEKELPLEGTATTEGILSILLITIFVNHINVVLTLAWMTFVETVTTTEGDSSSNISEMIEKLTQLEGSKVSKININEIPASITAVAREPSQTED